MSDTRTFKSVKFEKGGKLTLSFLKTRIEQVEIQEQLERLENSGELVIVNPRYTFSMKKNGDKYDLSFTKPVTNTLTVSATDGLSIQNMLNDISSLPSSNSTTNLLEES